MKFVSLIRAEARFFVDQEFCYAHAERLFSEVLPVLARFGALLSTNRTGTNEYASRTL